MILLTSLFTIFNALLLFSGAGKYTKGNYYLAFVFLLLGILGLTSPTSLNSIIPTVGVFLFPSSLPLNLLIGPLLFFYFRITIKKIPFQFSSDFKHLIIFSLAMINMLPFHLYSFQAKIKIYENFLIDMLSPFNIQLLFTSLSDMYLIIDVVTLFYLILCFIFLQKNKDYFASSLKSDGYRAINQWLIWLYVNFTILFFMNITTGVRAFYLGRLPEPFYFHAVAFILLILNIKLYQFPTLLYGIKLGTNEHQKKITLIHQNKKKSQFDENFAERYRLLLLELIQSKEIISQEFSIQLMASQLDVSTHSLNQYLKEELNINFSQLVNQSRIQVFINSTVPADFKKYSITGLVKLYGFKSLQQFKINFEKFASEEYETFVAKMKNNV